MLKDYTIIYPASHGCKDIEEFIGSDRLLEPSEVLVFPSGHAYFTVDGEDIWNFTHAGPGEESPECATLYCGQRPDHQGDLTQTLDSLVDEYNTAKFLYHEHEADTYEGEHSPEYTRMMRAVCRLHWFFSFEDHAPPWNPKDYFGNHTS